MFMQIMKKKEKKERKTKDNKFLEITILGNYTKYNSNFM